MAKTSTLKKKTIAKRISGNVKKATVKSAVKNKTVSKVPPKQAVKPKTVAKTVKKDSAKSKPDMKKIPANKTATRKKIVVAKPTAKPAANTNKNLVKTKLKVVPKKAVTRVPAKKVAQKPAPVIKKQQIKKAPVNVAKPAATKEKVIPTVKAKEDVKKQAPKEAPVVAPQTKENAAPARIINRPVIVPMKNCSGFEANFNRANMFYKNVLKVEIVKRYSCEKEEDHEFLKRDQNLSAKMHDRQITISEKTRDQDWNDIYVEIFRKYPDEEGWIKYTEADYLGYFFPGRVFWAKMEPIRRLCNDILHKALDSGIYRELLYMFPNNSGRLSKTFKINTKTYSFNFIQTYHAHGEQSYYSIGISLPFVMLADFRIEYKIYRQ